MSLSANFRFQHPVGGGKGSDLDYEPQLASFPRHIVTLSRNYFFFFAFKLLIIKTEELWLLLEDYKAICGTEMGLIAASLPQI